MEEFLEAAKENMEQALKNAETEYQKLFGGQADKLPEIYIISNELRVQGASVIFYTDVLEHFAGGKKIGLDLTAEQYSRVACADGGFGRRNPGAGGEVRDANAKVVLPEGDFVEHVYNIQ